MKITVVTVGKLKERYLKEAQAEYLKRLQPFAEMRIAETGEAKLPHNASKKDMQTAVEEEGGRLWRLVPKDAYVFALDLHGQMFTSEIFAEKIAAVTGGGKSSLAFVIGGAFGIAQSVAAAADFRLCLSPMTFTHQMTRIILIEQIYRAFKINNGEKYHW